MKPTLQLKCALGFLIATCSLYAQTQQSFQELNLKSFIKTTNNSANRFQPNTVYNYLNNNAGIRAKPQAVANTTVTDIALGCAENVWGGQGRPSSPRLDFSPVGPNGLLTMIHNSGPGCNPSDGTQHGFNFMVDVSKDGGTTWNLAPSNGPMGNFVTNWGQFPSALIYNPTGNTHPDSAFISYAGAGGNNSGAWNLYQSGAARISNPSDFKQTVSLFGSGVNFIGYTPLSFTDDGAGNTWYVDLGRSAILYAGDYNDKIIVRKGVWDSVQRKHNYTTTKLTFPVVRDTIWWGTMINDVNIAANGQTVYVSASGCGDAAFVAPDTLPYITVWKSTNGGTFFGLPYKISMDVNTQMGTTGGKYYSTGNGLDGAVDSQGNYHLILGIQDWTSGELGEFSIITDGTTNTKTLLDKPQTYIGFYGSPGGISDYNRGQIALSPGRDKVFYVWFDTDTASWQTWFNQNPDAISRMYDVVTSSLQSVQNLTKGTVADGKMTMGYVANWASSGTGCGGGPYKLHLGYQEATGNYDDPFVYHYVGSYCKPVNAVGIVKNDNEVFLAGKVFPNPSSGITALKMNLSKPDKINIRVEDIMGQIVYESNEYYNLGERTWSIDVSQWNIGLYFITVKASDTMVTQKFLKE